jgi:hypothetical protein
VRELQAMVCMKKPRSPRNIPGLNHHKLQLHVTEQR